MRSVPIAFPGQGSIAAGNPSGVNGLFVPNAIPHCKGFSLRPYWDTQVATAGQSQNVQSGIPWVNAPSPAAPGPFRVDLTFRNNSKRTIYVFDDREWHFGYEIEKGDITALGWGSNLRGSVSADSYNRARPILFNAGCISYAMLNVFDHDGDRTTFPYRSDQATFPLFYADVGTYLQANLPYTMANAPYINAISPGLLPAVGANVNLFGVDAASSFHPIPIANVGDFFTAGAFYVFRETINWRVSLYSTSNAADVQIWTAIDSGPQQKTGSLTYGPWAISEVISSANWSDIGGGLFGLVIERSPSFADCWMQLVVTDNAASYVVNQANMTVGY